MIVVSFEILFGKVAMRNTDLTCLEKLKEENRPLLKQKEMLT